MKIMQYKSANGLLYVEGADGVEDGFYEPSERHSGVEREQVQFKLIEKRLEALEDAAENHTHSSLKKRLGT